jgi:hypothetical protein
MVSFTPLLVWAVLALTALDTLPKGSAVASCSSPKLRPGGSLLGVLRGGAPAAESPDSSGEGPAAYEEEIRAPLRVAQRLYAEAAAKGDAGGDWGLKEHLKRKLRGKWDKVRMRHEQERYLRLICRFDRQPEGTGVR